MDWLLWENHMQQRYLSNSPGRLPDSILRGADIIILLNKISGWVNRRFGGRYFNGLIVKNRNGTTGAYAERCARFFGMFFMIPSRWNSYFGSGTGLCTVAARHAGQGQEVDAEKEEYKFHRVKNRCLFNMQQQFRHKKSPLCCKSGKMLEIY